VRSGKCHFQYALCDFLTVSDFHCAHVARADDAYPLPHDFSFGFLEDPRSPTGILRLGGLDDYLWPANGAELSSRYYAQFITYLPDALDCVTELVRAREVQPVSRFEFG
jgi:hypothetical protein